MQEKLALKSSSYREVDHLEACDTQDGSMMRAYIPPRLKDDFRSASEQVSPWWATFILSSGAEEGRPEKRERIT